MTGSLGIIDAGMGNVGSVANMARRLGADARIVAAPDDIAGLDRLVLPGVGAWDTACARLRETGMDEAVLAAATAGTPILGICLGMQLLLDTSDEGSARGLGWIPGRVARLPSHTARGEVRIPHMGWSPIAPSGDHPLLRGLMTDARYYFVHSFAAVPDDPSHVLATASYGDPFVAVIGRDNVVGTQFHPEKSHRHGKAVLSAFLHEALVPA